MKQILYDTVSQTMGTGLSTPQKQEKKAYVCNKRFIQEKNGNILVGGHPPPPKKLVKDQYISGVFL